MPFLVTQEDLAPHFLAIVKDISNDLAAQGTPPDVIERIIQSLQVNAQGGKAFRLRAVPESGRLLLNRTLTNQEFDDLALLGWMVELIQAYLLVADDIMDGSTTRRGRPCWYMRSDVGMLAINDACLLKSMAFILLKKYFRNHPCYLEIVEIFQEISFITEIGQECDVLASQNTDPATWTHQQYSEIALLKSGHSCFYFPVVLAIQYFDLATPLNIQQTKDILCPLGVFYQIQNDYNDIFANCSQTGKPGSDIKENKCAWVIITALQQCNEKERAYLREHYGSQDDESIAHVQSTLESLPLPFFYKLEEERTWKNLKMKIEGLDDREGLNKEVFEAMLTCVFGKHQ